jgi:hypothetical protein
MNLRRRRDRDSRTLSGRICAGYFYKTTTPDLLSLLRESRPPIKEPPSTAHNARFPHKTLPTETCEPLWLDRGAKCEICHGKLLQQKSELLHHAHVSLGAVVGGVTQRRLVEEVNPPVMVIETYPSKARRSRCISED